MVDTSRLEKWPDAGSIRTAATSTTSAASSYQSSMDAAAKHWSSLSSYYDTPHEQKLFDALKPAEQTATHVTTAAKNISNALGGFADCLDALEPRRKRLLADAATRDMQPCPAQEPEATEYVEQGRQLQRDIDALGDEFDSVVDVYAGLIKAIEDDGSQGQPILDQAGDFGLSTMVAGAGTVSDSVRTVITRTRTTQVVLTGPKSVGPWYLGRLKVMGEHTIPFPEGRLPLWGRTTTTSTTRLDFGRGRTTVPFGRGAADGFHDLALGERPGPWTEVSRTPGTRNGFVSLTQETVVTQRSGVAVAGRVGGRALFVAGAWLTYDAEHDKRLQELAETNPEMSADERKAKAVEAGAVRGGTQVVAGTAATVLGTAGTMAAFGSVIPVGGTVVGFGVGLVVGGVMMIPTGDGKNVGDRIGDAGEAIWNWGKGLFG